jgi:M6 family metalloprotease-like protein
MKRNLLLTVIILTLAFIATSAPLFNIPVTVKQPDGTELNCFASGDEFHNWLHDKDDYTIIQHPKTGFYVFALQDGDMVRASDFIAGKVDPSTIGIQKKVNIAPNIIKQRREHRLQKMALPSVKTKSGLYDDQAKSKASSSLSNIVIFIQFADDNITTEGKSFYDQIYNNTTQSSLYHYYQEVTNGQQTVNTTFLPKSSTDYVVWYTDSNARSYYRPYNATSNPNGYDPNATSGTTNRTYREHLLLKNSIEAVKSQLPADFNVDGNGDNYVDCISFIVSGSPDGWNELLWPHMWVLYSYEVYISNKRVYDYTFQLQYTSNGSSLRLGTIAHEMFHVIGAPDLYRYEDQSMTPVGAWDIMASTGSTPQQMTAYMKYLYGNWIDQIPTITQTGTYTLNPLQSASNNCYKIPSSASHSEYFVVEYRNKTYQYDGVIPGSGLIVYRINSHYGGEGNAYGPPDELYIYRPDNSTAGLSTAFYNQTYGRTAINSQTNPSPFLVSGQQGGLKISNIGAANQTISFDVEIDYTKVI